MRIQVNGRPQEVEENLSLSQLITSLDLKPEQIAIELNQKVIRRGEWQDTDLRDDDKIEIVALRGRRGKNRRQ